MDAVRPSGHLQVVQRAGGQRWHALWRDADGRHQKVLGPAWVATAASARRGAASPGALHTGPSQRSTYGDYRYTLDNHLLPAFGEHEIRAITRKQIETWHARYPRSRTAEKVLMILGAIFHHAQRRDLIDVNPVERVERHPMRYSGDSTYTAAKRSTPSWRAGHPRGCGQQSAHHRDPARETKRARRVQNRRRLTGLVVGDPVECCRGGGRCGQANTRPGDGEHEEDQRQRCLNRHPRQQSAARSPASSRPGCGYGARNAPKRVGCPATRREGAPLMRSAALAGLVVLVAVGLPACGGGAKQSPTPPLGQGSSGGSRLVSPRDFARAATRPGTVLINVHVPYAGEIAGTSLFLPYDKIDVKSDELPSRSSTLAIYCRTGRMSAIAARTLSKMGYRRIVELRGGMRAWRRSGLALRQRPQ